MGPGKAVSRRTPNAWRELQLIDMIRRASGPPRPGEVGIGDDAAAYRPDPGGMEIVTCDALVEGVHWEPSWCGPRELGAKTAAVNLSDIAAMGGRPQRAYLTLALGPRVTRAWVAAFISSLVRTLRRYGARLAGGDTVASPGPAMISLTLQGVTENKHPLLRSGAKAGDVILVTGELGGAAAGLGLARAKIRPTAWSRPVLQRLLEPKPRVPAGRLLAQSGRVHAMVDLSDGLGSDLRRLAQAGRVGAKIFASLLPIAMTTRLAARQLKKSVLELALAGGEDYELLFTAAPSQTPELIRILRQKVKCPCTVIGEILPLRAGLSVVKPDGRVEPLPPGWEHAGRPEGRRV